VFEPEETAYGNPLTLANSGAELDLDSSTIGGVSFSAGTGEAAAVTYGLIVAKPLKTLAAHLALDAGSAYATVSSVVTAGAAPNGAGYVTGTTGNINFENNQVLWVKAVSEDETVTKNYRFNLDNYDRTIEGTAPYVFADADGVKTLTITGAGGCTIAMKDNVSQSDGVRIIVASGVTVDITLNAVKIDMGAKVNLTLTGESALKGGAVCTRWSGPHHNRSQYGIPDRHRRRRRRHRDQRRGHRRWLPGQKRRRQRRRRCR
jgi:hypothetical protein